MSRLVAVVAFGVMALSGCHSAEYAVRPIPRIAADNVGKSVNRLQDALGEPRKIDTSPTKIVYVWFLPATVEGAPIGFHGCEMEVTVDPRSQQVLGFSLTNIGWSKCGQVERRVRKFS